MYNLSLIEAAEKMVNVDQIVTEFKKKLNVCKLAKYKSAPDNNEFYLGFFCNSLDLDEPLIFDDWSMVYNKLLSDTAFTKNLALYITMYQPADYSGMFKALLTSINVSASTIKDSVRYFNDVKAKLAMVVAGFESVCSMVTCQINDQQVLKFCTQVRMSLNNIQNYITKQINRAVNSATDPNGIVQSVRSMPETSSLYKYLLTIDQAYLQEATYLVDTLREMENRSLNENIINNAADKANELRIKLKHFADSFDRNVTKRWDELKEERKERKQKEIVGESLMIMNEFRRILISAPAAIISPGLPFVIWAVTLFIDRHTDQKDRDELTGMIKNELEICEEKISQADRKGDDKEKVGLIRVRQKLIKEHERISRVRYQPR